MRAFRALPIAGTNQNFAVRIALFAMKFVNRHGSNLAVSAESSSQALFGLSNGMTLRPPQSAQFESKVVNWTLQRGQ